MSKKGTAETVDQATNRGERRSQKAIEAKKYKPRERRYIIIPEAFRDVDDREWTIRTGTGIGDVETLDLLGVLKRTVRTLPVKTFADTQMTGSIFRSIKAAEPDDQGETFGYIEFEQGDWDSMISRFEEHAGLVWNGPDADFLITYLKDNVTNRRPSWGEGDPDDGDGLEGL